MPSWNRWCLVGKILEDVVKDAVLHSDTRDDPHNLEVGV